MTSDNNRVCSSERRSPPCFAKAGTLATTSDSSRVWSFSAKPDTASFSTRRKVDMYLYTVAPIDWWAGWQKPADVFRDFDNSSQGMEHEVSDWVRLWEQASRLARSVGWEGDCRQGPYVTVLPYEGGLPSVVIGWKQDNNGSTFIASEHYPLPWLGQPDAVE
jgi:hypothetical protein